MERAHARAAALHAARAGATYGSKRRGHADRARWHASFGSQEPALPSIRITMRCSHHTLGGAEAEAQFRKDNPTLPLASLELFGTTRKRARECGAACGATVEIENAGAKSEEYYEAAALIVTSNPGVMFGADGVEFAEIVR
jgi:hypothetical protein